MKPSLLTLLIGIIALSFAAMAQAQTTTTTTPSGPLCAAVNGVPTLNISVLKLPFDPKTGYVANPTSGNPTYNSPQPDPNITIDPNSAMGTDLKNAFAIAPQFLQQLLCNLDGVFINPQDCSGFTNSNVCSGVNNKQITDDSWGYREGPWQFPPATPPGHYGQYIAISAGPWSQAGTSAPVYSVYEQNLLNLLLPWPSGTTPPTYSAASSADTPAMSVVAALAHELGHVLWYDNFRPTPGGPFTFETFCDGGFFGGSWEHVDQPPTWREFGASQNSHVSGDVNISDIALALLQQGSPALAASLLHRIYATKGRWATLFSAFSPDEDFVETFKFYVLTKTTTPLTSLPITITAQQIAKTQPPDDIPKDYTNNLKRLLNRKVTCFQQAYP